MRANNEINVSALIAVATMVLLVFATYGYVVPWIQQVQRDSMTFRREIRELREKVAALEERLAEVMPAPHPEH